jgi:hypothetical protein
MAKQKQVAKLQSGPANGARGRTASTRKNTVDSPLIANQGAAKLEKRTETSRPIGKSNTRAGGRNRGDRRDMSATYTGTARHAARGNTPRRDVSTRKR